MLILQSLALAAAALVTICHAAAPTTTANPQQLMDELKKFTDEIKQTVTGLTRQVMLQQLFVEERIRSDGASGIKMVRGYSGGTDPYLLATESGNSINSIHEHSNYDRTVGMGEVVAVLNGVEFRTRHNDFRMVMPSTKNKNYNAVEDVPFPEVPPSVKNKHTVAEQVTEMQEYFRAFAEQDTKIRDYNPYFKPVMCYMEGGWTTDTRTLNEPFQSDRHFLDASSWFDLQEKVRYTSASGGKSQFENYSYLPTTIVNVTANGEPIYAQWNYRIVCHPIKTALSLRDLQLKDDLGARMYMSKNMTEFAHYKAARFSIAPGRSRDYDRDSLSGHFTKQKYLHGKLDQIMYEIPGKDNYMGHHTDNTFGYTKMRVDTRNLTTLDTSRYHRHFKVSKKGAMGLQVRNRGFSDPYLFVAQTNSPRIAEMSINDCRNEAGKHICEFFNARHTYAIPLEIIWLTPLSTWNPYNLHYTNDNKVPVAGGRDGGSTAAKAFNGTSRATYYYTPVEFYHGGEGERDPADTAKDSVGVLDPHGEVRLTLSLPETP